MTPASEPELNLAPRDLERPIRWWPAALILLLALGTLVWVWSSSYGGHRQDRVVATAILCIITVLFLLLWCLFLSRLSWKIRLAAVGGLVGLISLLSLLFRIHGVTGDLVPILESRWKAKPALALSGPSQPTPNQLSLRSTDYPQFLGPRRNATLEGPHLARDWKAQPPQRLWLHAVGAGWSGFAVAGNHAITQEQRDEDEAVVCYDLLSGAPLWSYAYPAHFQSSLAGEGPRATPTISGRKVYALGSTGMFNCLELETGKPVWTRDIVQDNQSRVNEWGVSCSPLLFDEFVVVSAGGRDNRSLVAYRAAKGDFVWGDGTDGAGYSSPLLATLAAVPQILIFNSGGVCAHEAATGKNLWRYPWPGGHPHVGVPVVLPGDRVLVSSGYGVGSELIKIDKDSEGKFSATRIWKTTRLKAKFTNLVYRDGFIYGLDDGIMVCLDAANGELKWKEGRYGHGQEILVGDLLLVTAESGEVVLLDPDPREFRELTRFSALKGKMWNPPALAGEYLLVRNEQEAACYRLPVLKE